MNLKVFKTTVLLFILIGVHQTVRVYMHEGQYTIQDPSSNLPGLDKLKVNLDNERISIEGGCNTQSTAFTIKNGLISYGPWISTLRYCPDDHDAQVLKFFETAAKVSALGSKIYLYDRNGEKILKLKKVS